MIHPVEFDLDSQAVACGCQVNVVPTCVELWLASKPGRGGSRGLGPVLDDVWASLSQCADPRLSPLDSVAQASHAQRQASDNSDSTVASASASTTRSDSAHVSRSGFIPDSAFAISQQCGGEFVPLAFNLKGTGVMSWPAIRSLGLGR